MDDIKYVINYDYPQCSEDYVHRIGRTGRRDKQGTAYTFFTYSNARSAKELIKVLAEANQNVPPELQQLEHSAKSMGPPRGRWGGGGGGGGENGMKRSFGGGGGGGGAKRGRFDGGGRGGGRGGGGGGGRW